MKKINFEEPFLLDVVHRETQGPETGKEYKYNLGVQWENIMSMKSFAFEDDWRSFPGAKFYITLYQEGTYLALGSFKDMFNYWKQYKRYRHGTDPDL